jgi:RNA polymerase sigma-70 factor (ECF subfamily)
VEALPSSATIEREIGRIRHGPAKCFSGTLPACLDRRLKETGTRCRRVPRVNGQAVNQGDELLRRCRQRDETALDALVRCYQDRIYHLAFRVAGDAALAEEAAAHCLARIWERAGQWRGEANADTWIYRIVVRAVLDLKRSRQRWWRRWSAAVPSTPHDPRPGPAEETSRAEEQVRRAQRVERALNQLPDADRALVHLYYFENRSLGEIEAILGVSKASLKMRLARAREKLRGFLGGDDNRA